MQQPPYDPVEPLTPGTSPEGSDTLHAMNTMGGMPMHNQMMGMMPMMNPMMGGMQGMNMMPMMRPMMCKMTMEMGKDGMVCKMMPTEGVTMEMMKEYCEMMGSMMAMGRPMMMMCNGMPMLMMSK